MTIISALPNNLTNGTTADATQVMADFNQIVNNVNANAAPLSNPLFSTTVNFTEQASAPAAPGASTLQLWSKTDGTLHIQNSSAVDQVLAILGAQTFTGLQTFNAGISIPTGQSITGAGTAGITGFATIALGTGYLSYGGTAAGLSFDSSNNATFSAGITCGTGIQDFSYLRASSQSLRLRMDSTASATIVSFFNNNTTLVGTITTSGSATAYNTSSDSRLKNDLGVATSTDVLSNTVVHDHTWKGNGEHDRNVFAQEAVFVKLSAVNVGTDELNEQGLPAQPWGVDYSKYVPELIVGWQQHESRLAQLRADFDAYRAAHP